MIKKPSVWAKDFNAYRIHSKDFHEFWVQERSWPKIRFGTVKTSPWSDGNKILEVHYKVEFLNELQSAVELVYIDPFTGKECRQNVDVSRETRRSYLKWCFDCPIKVSKWCRQKQTTLWLGKLERFSCQECGKIVRASMSKESELRFYRKEPSKALTVLTNQNAREKQKKLAYLALEKLSNKFKKMTKNYETLTVSEKRYYAKLRDLIYPTKEIKKAYERSRVLYDQPLPFQTS